MSRNNLVTNVLVNEKEEDEKGKGKGKEKNKEKSYEQGHEHILFTYCTHTRKHGKH